MVWKGIPLNGSTLVSKKYSSTRLTYTLTGRAFVMFCSVCTCNLQRELSVLVHISRCTKQCSEIRQLKGSEISDIKSIELCSVLQPLGDEKVAVAYRAEH